MPFSLGKVCEVSWLRKHLNWLINGQLSPRTWMTTRHYLRGTPRLASLPLSLASCFIVTERTQAGYLVIIYRRRADYFISVPYQSPACRFSHKLQTHKASLGSLCASSFVFREDTVAAELVEHLNTPLIPGFGFLAFIWLFMDTQSSKSCFPWLWVGLCKACLSKSIVFLSFKTQPGTFQLWQRFWCCTSGALFLYNYWQHSSYHSAWRSHLCTLWL